MLSANIAGVKVKLLHIVGARPQFSKVAAVSRGVTSFIAEGKEIEERLLHTGQHYDDRMSSVFFDEMGLKKPDYNLGVGSGSMGYQTAASLEGIFDILTHWRPDCVVVYGDTNATLGGAIATIQQHLPLAHVESGVRTGNLYQAEELNRVVTDRICDLRFCCTKLNLSNLVNEGLKKGSFFSGDTMLDNYHHLLPRMDESVVQKFDLVPNQYILSTIHRAENTDYPDRLNAIIDALITAHREVAPVVLPIHPRTQKAITELGRMDELSDSIKVIEPQGFNALQALNENCRVVFSDSGGLLRESYFAGRYCVIPWEYAAWPELVEAGWADAGELEARSMVTRLANAPLPRDPEPDGLFGDGTAGFKIVRQILDELS